MIEGRFYLADGQVKIPGNYFAVALLFVDVLIWAITAFNEGNSSIIIIHVCFLILAIWGLFIFDKTTMPLFSIALLLRSIFSIIAWNFAGSDDLKFYVGTNEDSFRFWDASFMSYEDAIFAFADPLFPGLNIAMVNVSEFLDSRSYLALIQTVIFSGALFVIFAYKFMQDLYGKKIGQWVGYALAFSPTVIAFSTGLIRDSLIGMFGFLMLLSLCRIKKTKYSPAFIFLISTVALFYLRPASLFFFAIVAGVLVYSSSPLHNTFFSNRNKKIILGIIILIGALLVVYKQERIESIFDYAIATRSGEHLIDNLGNDASHGVEFNTSGVMGKISAISPLLLFGIAPFALMQPFPFYAWDPPDFIGGRPALMDLMVGIGALFNQLLMGFYVIAAIIWIKNKSNDSFGFRVGLIFTCVVCGLILVGLGQIRMTAMHLYPFFYLGVALAISRIKVYGISYFIELILVWIVFLTMIYLTYFSLSILFLMLPLLGISIYIILFFIYKSKLAYKDINYINN